VLAVSPGSSSAGWALGRGQEGWGAGWQGWGWPACGDGAEGRR